MSEMQVQEKRSASHAETEIKESDGRLTRWLKRMIHSNRMLLGIGTASFLEAIIVPIPLETILIPLLQARRDRILAISTSVLVGCLLGALVGYGVGFYVFDLVGQQLISLFSSQEQFDSVKSKMQTSGFGFVFSVGVIPIPFQIAMLAAGATKFSLVMFLFASALSRGIRYYGLALLVYFTGNRAEKLFKKHKVSVSIALLVVVGLFWLL